MREHSATPAGAERLALLRRSAEPLPDPDSAEFAALFDRYADARVVLIGEASHGTAEFYRTRAAITRCLIERHGFDIVAVEADWPDAAQIDRQVRHLEPPAWHQHAFQRFPTWMWRNREVAAFCDWLSRHNRHLPSERRVEFRGLDVYSLGASIRAVLDYLDRTDAQAAQAARLRYGCLTPWQDRPTLYGRNVLHGLASCEDAVVEQLRALLDRRLERLGQGIGLDRLLEVVRHPRPHGREEERLGERRPHGQHPLAGVRLRQELYQLDPEFGIVLQVYEEEVRAHLAHGPDLLLAELSKVDRQLQRDAESPPALHQRLAETVTEPDIGRDDGDPDLAFSHVRRLSRLFDELKLLDQRAGGRRERTRALGEEQEARADGVDLGVELDHDGLSRARRALDREGREHQERRRRAHEVIIGSC